MNNSSSRDVEVFSEAIQLPAEQRAEYLNQACAGDADLRRRVEALLQTHEEVGDFLEQSPQQTAIQARPEISAGEKPGDWIGRYKLLQQIGEGGCGVVFMAEQKQPVHRRVALKIIKPGMDTKSVIARFEAERQALALMDHPNIAKVFDAGATESGRPYFVMELIRGVKITEYCDQHVLPTEERLKLFIQVCHAVQHAHQKGIIHRDIKPSNILVTTTMQGETMPMVIDFGIAKATTNQQLTDKTLFTAFEMLIGTPAYMSPEQAAMTNVDVDTRTDIYSLGVLLYELLTGSTPFDTAELLQAGIDEARKIIRDREPVRPSTRLSKLSEMVLTNVALQRQSEPPILIRSVSGDLDWIAMKALEKDRTRRYETANGLALDVQRYLADEPISARPPSRLYKFQKSVSRHKLLYIGISFVAALLVLSLVVVSASLAREWRARREAEVESAKSQQVTQFLEDMLQSVGPSVAMGRDTTMLREILDRTAKRVGTELTNQPADQIELGGLIGRVYLELGYYDQAESMHREAIATAQRVYGRESLQVAAALNDLGRALCRHGKLADAVNADEEALGIRRKLLGNDSPEVAATLVNLSDPVRQLGRGKKAESLTRESLAIVERRYGKESLQAADALRSLSMILGDEGKWLESEATTRKVLAIRRQQLGPEAPQVATSLTDVAWAAGAQGKLKEALSLELEALTIRRKILDENHPDIAKSLYLVGDRLREMGKLDQALPYLNQALALQTNLLGEANATALDTMRSLGQAYQAQGKLAEAERIDRKALALWRKQGEGDIPQALTEVKHLVAVLEAGKKFGEAEQVLATLFTPTFVKQPANVQFLNMSVDLLGKQQLWREAATNAVLVVELQPDNPDAYHTLAPLLAITQQRSAYDDLCQKILKTFGNTTNIYIADRMAKDCLLLPVSGLDLKPVARLADIAVSAGKDNPSMPFFETCKALSEYRMRHFADAVAWAANPLRSSQVYARAHAYAVIAMANWQLGKKDDARAMLEQGENLASSLLPPSGEVFDSRDVWLSWLFAKVSLEEAATLIQSGRVTNY